jgi:hypothetical protein
VTATHTSRDEISAFLRQQIERANALRTEHLGDPQRSAKWQMLREWQQDRLSRTYRDLLDSPRYRPAAEFFLSDVYGVKDTSKRDAAVKRLYPTMVRLMPEAGLRSVGLALELDALSEELDAQLLDVLQQQSARLERITESDYCEAYRRCDNYALRKRQIELFRAIGTTLAVVVERPMIYSLLRGMRQPARLAGLGGLQDFLERGFHAFRHMEDPGEFLDTIDRRETSILDRIYAHHPRPFEIDD